jgi:hypothetical protein
MIRHCFRHYRRAKTSREINHKDDFTKYYFYNLNKSYSLQWGLGRPSVYRINIRNYSMWINFFNLRSWSKICGINWIIAYICQICYLAYMRLKSQFHQSLQRRSFKHEIGTHHEIQTYSRHTTLSHGQGQTTRLFFFSWTPGNGLCCLL